MKKLAFAFSVVILSCFITCTNNTAHEGDHMSEKAKKNIDMTTAAIKMFDGGDFTKAGDYIANDGVDHSGPTGEVKGLDSLKAMFVKMTSTMTNTKNEIKKILADDDHSMVWLRQTWTQKVDDPMMGMKAGQNGDIQTVEVFKHGADGKITDHWAFMSMNDMMKMMPQMPADTSGKK